MPATTNHSDFIKPLKWLLLALGIKLILYLLFILPDNNPGRQFSRPFILSADHSEYIEPIDNLIEKGSYVMNGYNEPYAGRLPGFVFPYILFRALFSEFVANMMLGIFILALAVLASYFFSLLLLELVHKRWAFATGFLLMNFVPFFWHYDWTLHVNSLAASSLIFLCWFSYKYYLTNKKTNLLIAGFFLAWLVLLRGFCLIFIPLLLFFLVYFLYKNKNTFKQIAITCFLFILPFLIFETAWVTRNYISLHKFIPLQTSFVPGSDSKNPEYGTGTITKYSMMKVRRLIFAWGGDNTWYFNNADMAWFTKGDIELTKNFEFDRNIFFDGFTPDSLNLLRSAILYSYGNKLDKQKQDSVENVISETSTRYYQKFKQNNKLYFYLYAPVKRLKNYLFRNTTQDWPGPSFKNSGIIQKLIKLFSLTQYLILLIALVIFPFIYLWYRKTDPNPGIYLLFYVFVLATIIPFMAFLDFAHFSYFIFGYVLLIPLFIFVIRSLLPNTSKTENK